MENQLLAVPRQPGPSVALQPQRELVCVSGDGDTTGDLTLYQIKILCGWMFLPECMSIVRVLYACLVPAEATEALDLLGLELEWLGAAMWVLEVEPKSPGRTASTLNC